MQIISADMGRSESKFYSNNQKLKFRSVVGEWHKRNLSSGGDYDVQIDVGNGNENYFIGDLSLKESYLPRFMETESKIHEETRLLFAVGIAQLVQEPDIVISTGLPVKAFNVSGRDEIVDLLKGKYTVTFQGCNPKHFFVNQITVLAEGSGTYFYEIRKRPELKKGKVRVINFGSKTINFISICDGNFLDRNSGTLDFGMNLNNSKSDYKQFSRKVIGDLSAKWNDYDENSDTILMSGGGIIELEKYMKQHFKNSIISDEPIFSDAYGFNYLASAKHSKMIAK